MMRRFSPPLLVAGALVAATLPAAAAAQAPPPVAPTLSITPDRVTVGGGRPSAFTGQPWQVRVVLKPLVPGQTAVVRFYRKGRRVRAAQLPLAPSPTGQSAYGVFRFTSAKAGRIVVRATHFAT